MNRRLERENRMDAPRLAYTRIPSPEHKIGMHPENPGRFQHFDRLEQGPYSDRMLRLQSEPAAREDVEAVHSGKYLQALEEACRQGPGFVDYGDTYVTPTSFEAAMDSAGGGMRVVQAVLDAEADMGFALNRPPGHHATETQAMGFCLLNNIAIAARYAQKKDVDKVMIIDYDVHHGNGTQDLFEADPNVLYLSTHQSGIYPGTGKLHEVGRGAGEGSLVNVPLPARTGDEGFELVVDRIMLPVAERFQPDLLLISAGFDAHWNDPLAGLQLTTSGFHALAASLKQIADAHCDCRIVFFLEGGYDPEALAFNIDAVLRALFNLPLTEDPLGPAPKKEPGIHTLVDEIREVHGL
jgi:acetoin utilization deacetylase AcuC-like enzyme